MKKTIRVYGFQSCNGVEFEYYLGKVKDFCNMDEHGWLEMKNNILDHFGAVYCHGAKHQMSKLCFTSKIDKMRKQ